MVNVGHMPNFDPLGPPVRPGPAQKGRKRPVLMNFSKFFITSSFLGVLTWDRHHLKGIFQGYKNDLSKFCYDVIKGVKTEVKGHQNLKISIWSKMPSNTPKITKNAKKSIFSQYFMIISPFFQKNLMLQVKTVISKMWPLAPYLFHVLGHNSGSGWNFWNLFTYLKTREKMQSEVCQQIFSI